MIEFTTMCYLEQNNQYLMLYRNKRKNDLNGGKWIGVGGHLIKGETKEECLVREVKEETGLTLLDYQLRCTLYFDIDGLEEVCYVYTSKNFCGTMIECDEGELHWVFKDKVKDLNLWAGDYLFLDKIQNNDPYFEMKLVYRNDELDSYEVIK